MKLALLAIFVMFCNLVYGQDQKVYDLIQVNLDSARAQNDYQRLADAYFERANYYFGEDYKSDQVLDDLQQSSVYYRYVKDSIGIYSSKLNIAKIYVRSKNFYKEAIEILNESAQFFEQKNEKKLLANSKSLLSNIYEARQDYSKALLYINEAININLEIQDKPLEIENGIIRANLYNQQGYSQKAIKLAKQHLKESKTLKNNELIVKCLTSYGNFQLSAGDYDEAIVALEQAEKKVVKGTAQQADIYELLAKAFTRKLNFKVAYAYQSRYTDLIKELLDKGRSTMVSKLSIEYQTQEKEKEIQVLEVENEASEENLVQAKRANYTLWFASLASIIAALYILLFYRQKIKVNNLLANKQDEISKQEIKKLEDELKIKGLESMIEGQEQERKRIATDLHDSLGGTLSTLKLQFDNYSNEKEEETERGKVIHRLIDEACVDVRKIARNLKPSAIENVGLEAAVIDLINKYKNTRIEINFHSDSEDHALRYESKLQLYRIIQELLSNTIKHAEATEVTIQLYTQDNELILMVEDDGIGFDYDTVEKGLGLENIKSRINILKGDLSIDSSQNRGTSIVMHVPISDNIVTEDENLTQS